MPHPGLLHPEPLWQGTADHTSTGDTQTLRQVWLSLCGVFWCTQVLFEASECVWEVWGLVLNVISPFLSSCSGFSFALGRGVSFFGGTQHSPVENCPTARYNFGVLSGEDEYTSFYSAIL